MDKKIDVEKVCFKINFHDLLKWVRMSKIKYLILSNWEKLNLKNKSNFNKNKDLISDIYYKYTNNPKNIILLHYYFLTWKNNNLIELKIF